MKKVMKTLIALSAVGSFLLTGCGSGKTFSSSDSGNGQEVALTFLNWRGEDVPTFKQIISEFQKKYPNINVQMQVIPSNQYIAQAQANLTGNQGADIFTSFPGSEFSAISQADLYEDLSNQPFLSNFNSNLIKSGQKDGKQLAIPYQVVFNMPIYNKDLFKKLNIEPPTDWNGFLKASQTLKDNGYTPIMFAGKVSAGQFYNDIVMNNVTDPNVFTGLLTGKSKLTDPGFLKSFEQMGELAKKGYFQTGALGTSQDAATAIFAEGKAGMLALGSYQITPVNKDNNNAFKMGLLAPITSASAADTKYQGVVTTTFMLGVNAKSQHKKEAEEFLQFLSQPDIAAEYANKTSQMVTVKDVKYTVPALQEMQPLLKKPLRFQPMYTLTNQQVVDDVTNVVEDVISGKDPKEAAIKGQEAINQALSLK